MATQGWWRTCWGPRRASSGEAGRMPSAGHAHMVTTTWWPCSSLRMPPVRVLVRPPPRRSATRGHWAACVPSSQSRGPRSTRRRWRRRLKLRRPQACHASRVSCSGRARSAKHSSVSGAQPSYGSTSCAPQCAAAASCARLARQLVAQRDRKLRQGAHRPRYHRGFLAMRPGCHRSRVRR